MRYTAYVIRTFEHKGLEKFFRSGSLAGIQAKHANRLRLQLAMLDNARTPDDMNAPAGDFTISRGNSENTGP
jgi:proteic killer suppression protein